MSTNLSLTRVVKPMPGWYRGDFHCHTHCSDGVHAPPELLHVARQEGLDFFAITDHNTVEAYTQFGDHDDLCVIPGLELTLREGHYNVFGVHADGHDPEWQDLLRRGPHAQMAAAPPRPVEAWINRWMAQAMEQGLLNSINHPFLAPWAWTLAQTELAYVHCLELWNDPSWADNRTANPRTVDLWTRLLNDGHRITGIGGSDYHKPTPGSPQNLCPERLGRPSTYVYAEELSGQAILAGLRRRRAYVSMGPRATFQAWMGGDRFDIGDDTGAVEGVLHLRATATPIEGPARALILGNGEVLATADVHGTTAEIDVDVPLHARAPAWFRFDLLDGDGLLLVTTNPIFTGPARTPSRTRYGDFLT